MDESNVALLLVRAVVGVTLALGIDDELDGYVGLIVAAGGGLAAAVGLLAVFYRPPAKA